MIELSWPPRELHPNARCHFHAKAQASKAYREAAYWRALSNMPDEFGFHATIEFHPPDKRRRDLDGMLSSVKAGLDGIADAFAMNDYQINPITIVRRPPITGGMVIITLGGVE